MNTHPSYCAPIPLPPQAFAANDWNAVNNSQLKSNSNFNLACSSSCRCNSSSSSQQQWQQENNYEQEQQQHTTSLVINNSNNQKKMNKHLIEETTSIDLPTLPKSMPSTPMQPLHTQQQQHNQHHYQYKIRTTNETRYERSYKNFHSDSEQDEHNIDEDSGSNLSINTSPPCTQTQTTNVYSCSNNFEPLTQLKRKWTKLQRHRHRRRHSNGSCGDAKELDKLVLQSVAWDDSDIY